MVLTSWNCPSSLLSAAISRSPWYTLISTWVWPSTAVEKTYSTKTFIYAISLFFLWFPLCRGEAGLLVTPMYGYFCDSSPLVPAVGHFAPFIFLLCLFTQSSHLSCGLPRFLEPSCFFVSDLFGNYHLSF